MAVRKEVKHVFISFSLAVILGVIGCAPQIHTLVPDYEQKKPHSIAILPVLNETNDLDAPQVVLPIIHTYMQGKGYKLKSREEVKALLAEKNIHEAGQMFSLTYPEMGQLLGVDALLYCTVTDWSTLYLVVYSSVTVETKFELIEASSGNRLWEASWKSSERRGGVDQDSLRENLLSAALSPYEPRAREAVSISIATLPPGPYYVPPKAHGCLLP